MSIYTQQYLYGTFSDPLDFITAYIEVYDLQKRLPRKIFFKYLPYSKHFETNLLSCLMNSENEYFFKIENILKNMIEKEYYDFDFHVLLKDLYFKSVLYKIYLAENIIFDHNLIKNNISICQYESMNKKETNNLINAFLTLFKFTNLRLNVSNFFISILIQDMKFYLQNPKIFVDKMLIHQKLLQLLNNSLFSFIESSYYCDSNLMKRICISEKLISKRRKTMYEIKEYIRNLIDSIKLYMLQAKKEFIYLHIMNLDFELSQRGITLDGFNEIMLMAANLI